MKTNHTINEIVCYYRIASRTAQTRKVREFYEETANVLEASAFLYNDLYAAAKDTIERCNGQDPALNILAGKMREHMTVKKKKGEV